MIKSIKSTWISKKCGFVQQKLIYIIISTPKLKKTTIFHSKNWRKNLKQRRITLSTNSKLNPSIILNIKSYKILDVLNILLTLKHKKFSGKKDFPFCSTKSLRRPNLDLFLLWKDAKDGRRCRVPPVLKTTLNHTKRGAGS